MSGKGLKILRISSGIKGCDLARHVGVSQGRVSQVESMARVTSFWANRYLAALDRLTQHDQPGAAQGQDRDRD